MTTRTSKSSFAHRCISETHQGLCKGLSHYCGPSKVAVIYAINRTDELQVYDPENLLKGHELRLKDHYIRNNHLAQFPQPSETLYDEITYDDSLRLDGIFSCGGSSSSVFYQMWFTTRHPDICSPLPIIKWLSQAVTRFSHDIANQEGLYTGVSGHFLKEYASYAVHDSIKCEAKSFNDSFLPDNIVDILDITLGISRTHEEGHLPFGKLSFLHSESIKESDIFASFHTIEQPQLTSFKHVRKILQAVEETDYHLLSNGHTIIGIASKALSLPSITAEFHGKYGFLYLNGTMICSFRDGKFFASTHQAKLVEIEEILLEYNLSKTLRSSLFQSISSLVHNSQTSNFGSTIIVDLTESPISIAGQPLASPLDLNKKQNMELAGNLMKVDGAIHIGKDHKLHAFACLLDGKQIIGEDRSRGARYNSALRFSSENKDTIIVVVSSDRRPVATIYRGMELSSACDLPTFSKETLGSKLLNDWIGLT